MTSWEELIAFGCAVGDPRKYIKLCYYYKLKGCKVCRRICVFLLGDIAFHILSVSSEFIPSPVFLTEVLAGDVLLKLAEE